MEDVWGFDPIPHDISAPGREFLRLVPTAFDLVSRVDMGLRVRYLLEIATTCRESFDASIQSSITS